MRQGPPFCLVCPPGRAIHSFTKIRAENEQSNIAPLSPPIYYTTQCPERCRKQDFWLAAYHPLAPPERNRVAGPHAPVALYRGWRPRTLHPLHGIAYAIFRRFAVVVATGKLLIVSCPQTRTASMPISPPTSSPYPWPSDGSLVSSPTPRVTTAATTRKITSRRMMAKGLNQW